MKIGNKTSRILFLSIILVATFGAGLADMLTEVIPIRPYTGVFHFTPIETLGRSSAMSEILIVSLIVVLIASLIVAVANRTTGIVISHVGGPAVNGNLTGTPGLTSILPLLSLFFAFIGLVIVAKHMKGETGGI